MSQNYTYDEIFQRNIGIFTPEEQERFKNLRVAIAGAGGIGGYVAYLLARLGVGKIKLADPETFEVSNLNRQYGAYLDSIGKYKSVVVAEEIKRFNPYIEIDPLNVAVNKENIESFLTDVDIVVDTIDFYALEDEILLHKRSKDGSLKVFIAQAIGNIYSFTSFTPEGISFEETFITNGEVDLEKAIKAFFPALPDFVTPDAIGSVLSGSRPAISCTATVSPVIASLMVEEIIKSEVRLREAIVFPEVAVFDTEELKIERYRYEAN